MNENGCLIGVDAGTSFIKAVAFDIEGREIAKHEVPHQPLQRFPLWVEQNITAMWDTVRVCVAKVAAAIKSSGREILGIGLTSTGDGTYLMDAEGNPVRPGMMWCDGRAGQIVARWHAEGRAKAAFEICGTSVFTGSQAVQLTWLKEHEPEALIRASTIFHAKDFLFYKLTGRISTDETDESLTMLRMSTRKYDRQLFSIFGLEDLFSKFPEVLPSQDNVGHILPPIAQDLGLPQGLLVASGPMDVAACALGSGAIDHSQASSILGTAGIHQVVMSEPILEPKMVGMTLCHGVKGRWIRMMAAMTATPNLDWFLKHFGSALGIGETSYQKADEQIRRIPAGSEGVLYHPYLFPGGERGPFVKPTARASFTGLTMNHSALHLLRAVYEGVAFSTLDCYRSMPVETQSVHLSGGGASSSTWCQILSDCLGKTILIPSGSEFGARGAALNVGIALGLYRDTSEAVKETIQIERRYGPDRKNSEIYHELYKIYKMTYESQMDVWDRRDAALSALGQ